MWGKNMIFSLCPSQTVTPPPPQGVLYEDCLHLLRRKQSLLSGLSLKRRVMLAIYLVLEAPANSFSNYGNKRWWHLIYVCK